MASKLKMLICTSLSLIVTYGLRYYLRTAIEEFQRQKLELFKNPNIEYYNLLKEKLETQKQSYFNYVKKFDLEIEKNILENKKELFKIKPKFTIVLTIDKKNSNYLDIVINSIKEQIYSNYEIIVLDNDNILTKSYSDDKKEIFQDVTFITKAIDIQKFFNGDFICFLESGNKLTKNAFFKISEFLNKNIDSEVIYTDNDYFDRNNLRTNPFFKPDWSPYLFQSIDYISSLIFIKKEIFNKISLDDDSTNLTHNIIKKTIDISKKINHVKLPLCSINYELIPNHHSKIKNDQFQNKKTININNFYSSNSSELKFDIENEPLVSIIIPTKNNYKILKRCLTSIRKLTSYKNFEIIIVDNNSTDPELENYYNSLSSTVLNYEDHFNFSKMNNLAVKSAKGDFFLFLNDDTKVLQENWLHGLVSLCNQNDVGVVGPKLIYSNDTIQHAGSVILETGASFHPFQNITSDSNFNFNFLNVVRECSAVTGACLMTKKEIFNKVNGFDETFDVYYGDTDLCQKIIKSGYSVLYTPHVKLLHEGSHSIKSKMHNNTLEKTQFHFAVENHFRFITKWPELKNGDPFYNTNLGWDYSTKFIE